MKGVGVFQRMELLWTVWLGPFYFVCFLSSLDYCRLITDIYTISPDIIYIFIRNKLY